MTSDGWIRLHRQALDSAVFSDPWIWQLFCWCLLKANHKPRPWRGTTVPRGSFATGRASGAEQLQVSESKFRRGIRKLELMGIVTTRATNKYTVIRIEKYEEYQRQCNDSAMQPTNNRPTSSNQKDGENEKVFDSADQQKTSNNPSENGELFGHVNDERPTDERASDHQPTTNKKDKKGRIKKGFDPISIEKPKSLSGERFSEAWSEWCTHRAEINKKLTPTSTKVQLNSLAEMGAVRAVAAIRNSIGQGWQGIFEPAVKAKCLDEDTARRIPV